jgi:hypothetical protein
MYVDKQTVVEWQINFAVRSIFKGECPVSTHVIVMASKEILEQYAKQAGITLRINPLRVIRDEHARDFINFWKERYNFFKHANLDHNKETDIDNLQIMNESELLFNIIRYEELFKHLTEHMNIFGMYMAGRYPHWFNLDKWNMPDQYKEFLKSTSRMPRKTVIASLAQILADSSKASQEFTKVQELSWRDAIDMPEKDLNTEGKFFARTKQKSN